MILSFFCCIEDLEDIHFWNFAARKCLEVIGGGTTKRCESVSISIYNIKHRLNISFYPKSHVIFAFFPRSYHFIRFCIVFSVTSSSFTVVFLSSRRFLPILAPWKASPKNLSSTWRVFMELDQMVRLGEDFGKTTKLECWEKSMGMIQKEILWFFPELGKLSIWTKNETSFFSEPK